jgi:hypothetical protein
MPIIVVVGKVVHLSHQKGRLVVVVAYAMYVLEQEYVEAI